MKSKLVILAALALLSFNINIAQEGTEENKNSACLELVMDEINKDLKFLIENPEGNDSAIYHLTNLRNRILKKMEGTEERSSYQKQDSILKSNVNSAIEDQIMELQKERERLLKSSSESNPIIKNLDNQIEKLKQSKKEQ